MFYTDWHGEQEQIGHNHGMQSPCPNAYDGHGYGHGRWTRRHGMPALKIH